MSAETSAARRTGALCGVVGVAAVALTTARQRAPAEVPSPAELVGDRLGEHAPVKPFLILIGLIGTYGRLKALSVAVTLAAGAVPGAVDARVTERRTQAGTPGLGRLPV